MMYQVTLKDLALFLYLNTSATIFQSPDITIYGALAGDLVADEVGVVGCVDEVL